MTFVALLVRLSPPTGCWTFENSAWGGRLLGYFHFCLVCFWPFGCLLERVHNHHHYCRTLLSIPARLVDQCYETKRCIVFTALPLLLWSMLNVFLSALCFFMSIVFLWVYFDSFLKKVTPYMVILAVYRRPILLTHRVPVDLWPLWVLHVIDLTESYWLNSSCTSC